MNKLKLYNTLSRNKEEFRPIPTPRPSQEGNVVGLYTCGPTVYNFAHIGNLRAYVFGDILARVLRYSSYRVKHVMNITDVDDKTIRDSKIKYPDLDSMDALKKFTSQYEEYFWQDLGKLNIQKPDTITNATNEKYIKAMQDLVKKIVKAGYGYVKEGSVYFDVKKYSENYKYGKLINIDMEGFKSGARVDADEYEKENVQDFVLWKGKKEGEPSWEFKIPPTPFIKGALNLPGRPGWHIECSAMGEKELGCPFDIHTGGIDLKFPHHENEIAQSVIGYNSEQPVNYWLHNEYLLVDGKKMGKRFKNFYTIKDLEEKGYNPMAYRFLCLQTNYGKQMNFTWQGLKAAQEGLGHLYNQIRELSQKSARPASLGEAGEVRSKKLKINIKFKEKFFKAINDDLNMPQALAIVQELLKSKLSNEEKLATILDFDKVFGLNLNKAGENEELPVEIVKLVALRDRARKEKNFQESDRLREEIEKLGYIVEDTKEEMRVFRI